MGDRAGRELRIAAQARRRQPRTLHNQKGGRRRRRRLRAEARSPRLRIFERDSPTLHAVQDTKTKDIEGFHQSAAFSLFFNSCHF